MNDSLCTPPAKTDLEQTQSNIFVIIIIIVVENSVAFKSLVSPFEFAYVLS